MIYPVIYPETLTWHHDSGHAWLAVPVAMLKERKLRPSPYSYRKGPMAYLEEDVDASLILNLIDREEWGLIKSVYHKSDAPCRRFRSYYA